MKIIASVTASTFLVQATDDELARLMGFASAWALKDTKRTISVGAEIKVSELWRTIEHERQRPEAIRCLAESLREQASKLDDINKTVISPIVDAKE